MKYNGEQLNRSVAKRRDKAVLNIVLAVLLFVGVLMFDHSTDIQYQMNEQYLAIAGLEKTVFIEISAINKVVCVPTDSIITYVEDEKDEETVFGEFYSPLIGDFSCMVYRSVPRCIVVYHDDGIFIYNCHKTKKTDEAYDKLISTIEQLETVVGAK